MQKGKSIVELAQKLQDIKENSRDFIVPTSKLKVETIAKYPRREDGTPDLNADPAIIPTLAFQNGETNRFQLNDWSDRQLAQYADIPQAYYDRIKGQNPDLFAENVNHGLRMQIALAPKDKTESRMIRTYRGGVRALLSNKYRRLDCYDLFETVAPIMLDHGLDVVSSEITDRRMYLKATTTRITAEIKVGDPVQYGLVISSSDVGAGSVRIEPLIYRLVCTNGMITSNALRKFHIGKAQGEDDIYELLTDETIEKTDEAFWSSVRDVVLGSMKKEIFERQVDRLRIAANEPIKNFDIPRVIELASKAVGVTNEGTKQSMVAYLANGADGAGLTRWGLANAFTFAAGNDSVKYDDAVDLERAGSRIIDLTDKQWNVISSTPAAA